MTTQIIPIDKARFREAAWTPRPGRTIAAAILQLDDDLAQILPLENPHGDGYTRRWVPTSALRITKEGKR